MTSLTRFEEAVHCVEEARKIGIHAVDIANMADVEFMCGKIFLQKGNFFIVRRALRQFRSTKGVISYMVYIYYIII